MESHTEAEPEGLWDAVQAGLEAGPGFVAGPAPQAAAGSRRRRVAAGWWFAAGGSLAAAAAVALAVFLWKPAPEAPTAASPVPEGRLAQELPAAGEPGRELPGAGSGQELPGAVEPASSDGLPAGQVPQKAGDRAHGNGATGASELVSAGEVPATEWDLAQTPPPQQPQPAPQPAEPSKPEAPRQKESAQEKTEPAPVAPDPWPQAETAPRKRGKVRLSVTSGAYLAQAGVAVSQGYGIPSHPGMTGQTKAAQGDGISVPMLSRNRASTTETSHRQSARLALGVEYAFTPRWSVATGLSYTALRSDFHTLSGETSASTTRHLYYLGVPLNLQWKALEWNRLSINLNAGPMWETAIAARENTVSYIGTMKVSEKEERPSIRDPHWSLNAGVGVQYQLLRYGAVFLQPGLSWHLPGSGAVESWYTAHPLSPEFTFGFKFTF